MHILKIIAYAAIVNMGINTRGGWQPWAQHASRVGRSPAPARLALTHFGAKAAAFVATQINHGPSSPCCLQNEMVDANGTETRSVPCALINPALHRFRPASP